MYIVAIICLNGFIYSKMFQSHIAAQFYALALMVGGYKVVIIEF